MTKFRLINAGFAAVLLLLLVSGSARAQEGGGRQIEVVEMYIEYEWLLSPWAEEDVLCQIFIDHDGLPTPDEIFYACGPSIYQAWENTPPCEDASSGGYQSAACSGVVLHNAKNALRERTILVDLPEIAVWVELEGCTPDAKGLCLEMPMLKLTGVDPLRGEAVLSIVGFNGGVGFECRGSSCSLPLQTTPIDGQDLEFWATSSYGDSSRVFEARVRVQSSDRGEGWQVDVLSSQWVGPPVPACSQIWGTFPPLGPAPAWLRTPDRLETLASDIPYAYLAGRLIAWGEVEASDCPSDGFLPNGYADACGMERARSKVNEWQDLFDARLLEAARKNHIPAQLLKNLFAHESQFWPGPDANKIEYGLGRVTERGIDVLLRWNSSFFSEFCPTVLGASACEKGYLKQNEENQAMLRGAAVSLIDPACDECQAGVDLEQALSSVDVFAQMMLAQCEQSAQIIYNASYRLPYEIAQYEDMWRFTLAAYNGGATCVYEAARRAAIPGNLLDWEDLVSQLPEDCERVASYVDNVTKQ